jgi:adenosylcobinamide-phosphate synthase
MEPLSIFLAYFLDWIFGDPRWFPQPVKGMGRLIVFLERRLRIGHSRFILRIKGGLLVIVVAGGSAFVTWMLLNSLRRVSPVLETIAWILLGYTCLAARDLFSHVRDILEEIRGNDIEGARRKLSLIVGRDTGNLSEGKIITATVESIAESTNDGIIAPLFYLILGGPVLAIAYKAVNTLDSMVGHKNEKYKDFGWFSARLDDVANFIPARISGFLISLSSFILGKGFKDPYRIMLRDGKKHPSPNSGISEAAMAGALGVRLGGPCTYEGRLCVKSYIGEEKKSIQPRLINDALAITFICSILMVSIGALLKWII